MTQAEAIEKVRKLMKLATSPVQAEAELAAAKASEIMSKYELDSAALELTSTEKVEEEVKDFGDDPLDQGGVVQSWKGRLSMVISHLHGCQVYKSSGRLCLIGRPSDVATVRYLYGWICRQIDIVTDGLGLGFSRNFKTNFRLGMVDTISIRMKEAAEKAKQEFMTEKVSQGSTTALMLVNNSLALRKKYLDDAIEYGKQKLHLRASHSRGARFNDAGRAAGREAGHKVQFNAVRRSLNRGQTQLNA